MHIKSHAIIMRQTYKLISIHDLHVWTQDGLSHVMTLHIVAEKNYETIKNKIREIAKTFNIDHVTIEFEGEDSACEVKLN